MGTSAVSRREFVKTLAAGLSLAKRGHLDRAVSAHGFVNEFWPPGDAECWPPSVTDLGTPVG